MKAMPVNGSPLASRIVDENVLTVCMMANTDADYNVNYAFICFVVSD